MLIRLNSYDEIINSIVIGLRDKRMTQKTLAEKLNLSNMTINSWIKGRNMISIKSTIDIFDVFGWRLYVRKIKINEDSNDRTYEYVRIKNYDQLIKLMRVEALYKELSQKEVAQQTGYTQQNISDWFNKRSYISFIQLFDLCTFFRWKIFYDNTKGDSDEK